MEPRHIAAGENDAAGAAADDHRAIGQLGPAPFSTVA